MIQVEKLMNGAEEAGGGEALFSQSHNNHDILHFSSTVLFVRDSGGIY